MWLKIALSLGMLAVSIAAMLHSIEQSKLAALSVERTYQLLNLSKSIQTTSFEHKANIALYLRTLDGNSFERMNQARKSILDQLSKMQQLPLNSPILQQRLKLIGDAFQAVISESENRQPSMGGLIMIGPTIFIVAEGQIDTLNARLIAKLREFDDALQQLSQEQQKTAALKSTIAEFVMLFSLLAGTSILLFSLKALRNEVLQREVAELDLRIAATAFESQQGMLVTDADSVILRVNQAFTSITGYTAEETIGQTPRLLSSGRHDQAFYALMWDSINHDGAWEGEIWNRRKTGEVFPEYLTITAVKDSGGTVTNYVATLTDITLRKAAADEIKHLAFYDPLTALPNRRLLLDRLKKALASSARSGKEGALLFIDLDNFKTLNDTLGHDIGDLLLQQVAHRLESCVREGDTVARLGGDEFVLMLENLSQLPIEAAAQTEFVGDKILASLNQPYQLGPHEYHSTPSIGATLFNAHDATIDELLKQADIAMYQAKHAGRNAMRFYDPQMQAKIAARVELEDGLRHALATNQFVLHYQLQSTQQGQVVGAEALIRWQSPERGLISPLVFIPLAEENGMILPIGQWVLESACAQLKAWESNPLACHLQLAIKVSVRQFQQADFVERVCQVIKQAAIKPDKLKLELTENLMLDDIEDTITKMNTLRQLGVHFSMGGFGTGYSSLSSLNKQPIDQLKIDQSFVRDIATDKDDAAMVQTIIAMANNLGLEVIAEGVETKEQRAYLEQQGCFLYQGYLFSKPVPLEEFEALLKQA